MAYGFKIIVEGDYACFTRPELKVERVSYDVPTPGALEGLLKSIYWKPAIRYVIDRIVVFNPIQFENIRRNEVKEKVSERKIKNQMEGNVDIDPCIYAGESRSQRASMVLKNVKYGIEFHFELTGNKADDEVNSEKKHFNIIKRRLEKGQCFRTPCLGCSEFPVKKIVLTDEFLLGDICEKNRNCDDLDFGFMSYKVQFEDNGLPKNENWDEPVFSDKAKTNYYRPHMINGVIDVEKYRSEIKC